MYLRRRSVLVVLVVTAPPDAGLVAPIRSAVKPVVHAKEWVHAARVGGISVVDGAVIECERAHARSVAVIGGHVNAARSRKSAFRRVTAAFVAVTPPEHIARRGLAAVVVLGAIALLLLGDPNTEVGIKVAAKRGG